MFGRDDIVVRLSSFEMEELHADWLSRKDRYETICCDTVLGDESFEDVQALWCDLEDCAVFEVRISLVGSILDETGIHKVLSDVLGHIASHGERGRCSCGDDAIWISRIGPTHRLGEFEGSQVRSSLIAVDRRG